MLDWVASPEFDALLVETVRATYPAHEQEQFLAHFRGLLGLWVHERGRTPQTYEGLGGGPRRPREDRLQPTRDTLVAALGDVGRRRRPLRPGPC